MSLFIGLLAFAGDPLLQDEVKVGILLGSLAAGLAGWAVLRVAPRDVPAPRRGRIGVGRRYPPRAPHLFGTPPPQGLM